jgi:hypothetical protein
MLIFTPCRGVDITCRSALMSGAMGCGELSKVPLEVEKRGTGMFQGHEILGTMGLSEAALHYEPKVVILHREIPHCSEGDVVWTDEDINCKEKGTVKTLKLRGKVRVMKGVRMMKWNKG